MTIYHLPLHRQQHIFAREGITLPSSTLSDWMGKVSVALQPLADRLQTLLLTQPVLHADESVSRRSVSGRNSPCCQQQLKSDSQQQSKSDPLHFGFIH